MIKYAPRERFIYKDKKFPIISEDDFNREYIKKVNNFKHRFDIKMNREEFYKLKEKVRVYASLNDEEASFNTFKLIVLYSLDKVLLKEYKDNNYLFYNIIYECGIGFDDIVVRVKGDRCIIKDLINIQNDNFKGRLLSFVKDKNYRDYALKNIDYREKPHYYQIDSINEVHLTDGIYDFICKLLFRMKFSYLKNFLHKSTKHEFLDTINLDKNHKYNTLLSEIVRNVDVLIEIKKEEELFISKPKKEKLFVKIKRIFSKKLKEKDPIYSDSYLKEIYNWTEFISSFEDEKLKELVIDIQQMLLLLLKNREHIFVLYHIRKINESINALSILIKEAESKPKSEIFFYKSKKEIKDLFVSIKKDTTLFFDFMKELYEYEQAYLIAIKSEEEEMLGKIIEIKEQYNEKNKM